MKPNTITITANGDGTWTVANNGETTATLAVVGSAPSGYLSIDVRPAVPSVLQAIAYGVDTSHRQNGRRTDRIRIDTSSEPNGQLIKGAAPFVCVDITPIAEKP